MSWLYASRKSSKGSLAVGRPAQPPVRQQRHQVVDLRRGQRPEVRRTAGLAVVGRHPEIGPPRDGVAAHLLVADERQERWVVDLEAGLAGALDALPRLAVTAGTGTGEHAS